MTEELGKAYDVAEELLQEYPEARESDDKLIFYYLSEKLGWGISQVHKLSIINNPSVKSIVRQRRLIQNDEGRLLPSDEAEEKRQEKEQEYHDHYAEKKKARA